MSPRFLIVRRTNPRRGIYKNRDVLELPDAEHIHVTRHPDGTIAAVAMEYHGHKHKPSQTTWIYGPERLPTADEIVLWVDCPGGAA